MVGDGGQLVVDYTGRPVGDCSATGRRPLCHWSGTSGQSREKKKLLENNDGRQPPCDRSAINRRSVADRQQRSMLMGE